MKLIIYGNGRVARVVYQYLKSCFEVVCFAVEKEFLGDNLLEGLPVKSFEEIEHIFPPSEVVMLVAIGYVQMNRVRQLKCLEAKKKGYRLVNYIHPSVHIHDDLVLGENNVILDHVTLQPGVSIGSNNFIWSNAVVGHGSAVEDNCWITSGATIAGDSTIKSGCFLGINASIGHNVVIETHNFIGANSLIVRSTSADAVYVSKGSEKHRLDSQHFLLFSGV
jgi:sugar O-acyltransferase (sialic acid O-acetyltransferase NeuD family)